MFKNPGSKIQFLATIYFWFITIISIISAFVLGIEDNELNKLVFWSILLIPPTTTYISCLFLVAFGELVEDVKVIKKNSSVIK